MANKTSRRGRNQRRGRGRGRTQRRARARSQRVGGTIGQTLRNANLQ
jgi:hypothetical protein